MELKRVDTQRAYELIRDKITTLELAPGEMLNDQALAEQLDMGLAPVREALKLLSHDGLVDIPPNGIYVADVDIPELEQLSELRLLLETFCAEQAAHRATPDDLAVLEALQEEQATVLPEDSMRLFEIDHKFHQAIAKAARNRHLEDTLERFFGLSQRLWHLAMPRLESLSDAVEEHLELVEAIRTGDSERAGQIMHDHVQNFYDEVMKVLVEQSDA